MDVVIVISAIAIGLLLAELLLPTGGVLALIGAAGLVAAGIVALGDDSSNADAIGAGLIAGGVVSLASFAVVSRKVLRAHRESPVRTGKEELIGMEGEVRIPLNPLGQVFIDGALWRARCRDGSEIGAGSRVRVESVDGLTLIVFPANEATEATATKGS
jgi:membrane-bound serine protease (ClpP class)